jgi:hypothetical protein
MITCLMTLSMFSALAQTMPAAASQPAVPPAVPQSQPAGAPRIIRATPIDAPAIWAIGEGFRVDPITGRVREEWRLGGNPIPPDFNYAHKNLAWEAGKKRITLNAARNELVAYQLQIRGPAQGVAVTCSDLRGPGLFKPAVIKADRDIEVLKEWYLHVKQNSSNKDSTTAGYNMGLGWYADALVPVTAGGGFGQPFDIPDKMNNVPGQQWQSIWVDIYVPKDVPAGQYKGSVTVAGAGIAAQKLPVVLNVHDVTLSDDFACEVGLNNYGSIGGKGSDVRLRYYQMAHRHRMAIHEHYIALKVQGEGERMTGVWDKYDTEMGKYLDGSAFTSKCGYRGPGEGKPMSWIYQPFEILGSHAWPMPKDKMHTAEYDASVRAMLRDFGKHFTEKGWTKTDLMFFINGLDEPTKPEIVDNIRYFGDLVKSAGAPRTYYRGDINHQHDIGKVIPGYTEQMMMDKLAPVIDLWCCVADFLRTDFSVLLKVQRERAHTVLWFYQNREPSVGGYTLDDETIGLATWPVIAWKYGLQGCILWELSSVGPSKNIWVDPVNSAQPEKGTVHNMAGFLVYPSYPGKEGISEPITSVRLKSFRRGAQDFEYLHLLQQSAGRPAAMKMLDAVMGPCLYEPGRPYGAAGNWSHNPEDWNRMRLAVLGAVSKSATSKAEK